MSIIVSADVQTWIDKGIEILRGGGVIAYPTDTVYGLGADIRFPSAVKRIFAVKDRPLSMPLPLLVADLSQIRTLASVTPLAEWLIKEFMPGALTVVLPASAAVPDIVKGGGSSVAVRIPAHPVTLAIIRGLGSALIGTSANLSGKPSAVTAGEVLAQLGSSVDLIVDGGKCPGGKESTIVDASGDSLVIIREGAISKARIESVCRNNKQ